MATWSTQAAFREYQMTANGEMNVVERLASLLNTGQYSDVTVRVGRGSGTVTFKAHKLLLCTASQPLHKIVSTGIKNFPGENNPVIRFSDVDPTSFQHVLKYIYTDNLEITKIEEAIDLLKISKKWCLTPLTEKTIKYLTMYLDDYEPSSDDAKNDICNLLMATAEDADSTELHQKCWKIVVEKASKIIPCQGFLNLNEALLRKLLTNKNFEFKEQLTLFEAIRDWGMNQVIQRSLSVNELQTVIGDLLQHIDFKAIPDLDFMSTVLPSECLAKADMIAFFMSRGMEIPRDFATSNNNNSESKLTLTNGSVIDYEKANRYRRGYKIPSKEICQEHELRFRVDKDLHLLGVGFGFLFSDTDMGVTVHCQGPWEVRQWSDLTQAYCRVSWEKMQSADVRLMFNEPVEIEANQSYKILVKIGRMSSGSSEVDLWGGSNGVPIKTHNGTEFFFLKAATDPKSEVDKELTECKPGMITDIYYQLVDGTESKDKVPLTEPVRRKRPSPAVSPVPSVDETPIIQKPPVGDTMRSRHIFRQDSGTDSISEKVRTRPTVVSIEEPNEKFNPKPYQRRYATSPEKKSYELPWQSARRRPSSDEVRPFYLRSKGGYSSIGGIGASDPIASSSSLYTGSSNYTSPAGSRKSSSEEKPKWEIPRTRTRPSDTLSSYRSRDSALSSSYRRNEPSSYSPLGSSTRVPSPSSMSQRDSASTRQSPVSPIGRRDSAKSRASDFKPSYETTDRTNYPYSSRLGSKYGGSSLGSSSGVGSGSSATDRLTRSSPSGSATSNLRTGSNLTNSISSKYGSRDSGTSGSTASRYGSGLSSTGTPGSSAYTSKYGSGSSNIGTSGTSSSTSRFGTGSSSSATSGPSSYTSRYGTGSSTADTGSTGTSSSTSRYGGGLSSSRFGSSASSSPSYGSGVGRFGSGRSTIGSNYSGYTSRYGSYR